jgi:hypothetical protein
VNLNKFFKPLKLKNEPLGHKQTQIMKTISNFELLVKRILPIIGTDPNASFNTVARRVVQAHFITISNLELDRPVYFSLSYYVSNFQASSIAADLREFAFSSGGPRNIDLRFDGNGRDNSDANIGATLTNAVITALPIREFHILKTRNLLLAPGETGMVALFPNITGIDTTPSLTNILTTVSPAFEVRGFVKIQQEPNAEGETNPYINRPAQVLINSELRGTFLDNDFPTLPEFQIGSTVRIGMDFDHLAYALPLAEGKSHYTLEGV